MIAALLIGLFVAVLVISMTVLAQMLGKVLPVVRGLRSELKAMPDLRAVDYKIVASPRWSATIYRLGFKPGANSLPYQPAPRAAA